ncbi:predicted protein [Sclerotinia sclerotiorum 1980 UF-70]|uniref:Uncharacterized protein n=2 Tax=Sclerotinia sclerotiorum (strain ATCC 18683 / 1980 / Ss-1) TaxID=665079 RepID=A7EXS7_SCLS1|nr:predicted protein [Sclerotinia sclerotiorum 1980 UF-70]APA16029.1 hypothetical protein sscle_16g107990 [Sclerotinia sclerotiorum 1980 UF-70]EDN94269.1 predicted protein [Sclerotinia sclerotiorum 1980 UF-70]
MCIPANTINFICNSDISEHHHRYGTIQKWIGCDNYPKEQYRGQMFQEIDGRKPCQVTSKLPLAEDVCPDCRKKYGDIASSNIISHVIRVLERMSDVSGYAYDSKDIQCKMAIIFDDIETFGFWKYLDPARPDEKYEMYELPEEIPDSNAAGQTAGTRARGGREIDVRLMEKFYRLMSNRIRMVRFDMEAATERQKEERRVAEQYRQEEEQYHQQVERGNAGVKRWLAETPDSYDQ